jgi:hypothetical protein
VELFEQLCRPIAEYPAARQAMALSGSAQPRDRHNADYADVGITPIIRRRPSLVPLNLGLALGRAAVSLSLSGKAVPARCLRRPRFVPTPRRWVFVHDAVVLAAPRRRCGRHHP